MVIAVLLCAILVGFALAEPVRTWASWRAALPVAAAGGALPAVALVPATAWIDGPWLAAILLLLAAAYGSWGFAYKRRSIHEPNRVRTPQGLVPLAVFAPFALLALADWVGNAPTRDDPRLSAVTTFAGFILFTLGFGPVRVFFRQMATLEDREVEAGARLRRDTGANVYVAAQAVLRVQALAFILAVLTGVLVLLLRAEKPLGTDRVAGGVPMQWEWMLVGGVVASMLAVAAARGPAVAPRPRKRSSDDELALSRRRAVLAAAAIIVFGVVPAALLSSQPLHYPAATMTLAALLALLVIDSFVWNTALVPLIRLGWTRAVIGCGLGVSTGAAAAWLFGNGLWSQGHPVPALTALAMTLITLAPVVVVVSGIALCVWRATTAPQKPMHLLAQFVPQDIVLYVLLAAIAGAVPVAVISRLDALHTPGQGLAGIAPLSAAIGVIGAVYFFIENNWRVPDRERQREPHPELRALAPQDDDLRALNEERIRRLRMRVLCSNTLAAALLAVGVVWVGQRLS